MAFNEFEWKMKQYKIQDKISRKWFLHKDETTEEEKILMAIEYVDSTIHPHSWMGRSGFKKYLKKAMKIVKKYYKESYEDS